VCELSKPDFESDETLQLAITHLVQVIGEASSRTSKEFRDAHAGIEWQKIITMRHRLVHDYNQVDMDIVWDVASRRIPELLTLLPTVDSIESATEADRADADSTETET
jgi:uncharacterized protein with HEPN domain